MVRLYLSNWPVVAIRDREPPSPTKSRHGDFLDASVRIFLSNTLFLCAEKQLLPLALWSDD